MVRGIVVALFAGCLGLYGIAASAQEVVHATTGTVSYIDNYDKSFTLFQDNGSRVIFKDNTDPKPHIGSAKKLLTDVTAPVDFKKTGEYVLVFYIGGSNSRTAIALRSLGAGPFTSIVGTVATLDKGSHSISVEDGTGAAQTFRIDAVTIAEGEMGVIEGMKFEPQKGDRVRVVGLVKDGQATALFLSSE